MGERLEVWQKDIHLFGVICVGFLGGWFGGFWLSLVGFYALFGDTLGSVNLIFQV